MEFPTLMLGNSSLKLEIPTLKLEIQRLKLKKSNGYVGNFNFKVGIQKQITTWH